MLTTLLIIWAIITLTGWWLYFKADKDRDQLVAYIEKKFDLDAPKPAEPETESEAIPPPPTTPIIEAEQ